MLSTLMTEDHHFITSNSNLKNRWKRRFKKKWTFLSSIFKLQKWNTWWVEKKQIVLYWYIFLCYENVWLQYKPRVKTQFLVSGMWIQGCTTGKSVSSIFPSLTQNSQTLNCIKVETHGPKNMQTMYKWHIMFKIIFKLKKKL